MKSTLYIMMGAPGSGKTTFISNHTSEDTVHVSRDDIRFSMVAEGEEYFSKEKQVFKEYVKKINTALEKGYNVFADATHLNKASRNKLITAINSELEIEINLVWIKTPLHTCIEHNENRKGTRSFVPRSVIRRMFAQTEKPEFEEGFNAIYIVEDNKPIQVFKER